jgi:hypothetical protein
VLLTHIFIIIIIVVVIIIIIILVLVGWAVAFHGRCFVTVCEV